jgi:putative transcription factor
VVRINCDLCGKDTNLIPANIEGSVLNACHSCAQFGTSIAVSRKPKVKFKHPKPQIEVVANYAKILKDARREIKLTQDQVARALNEKISVIQKVESGKIRPSLSLAAKLEKFFSIQLTEEAHMNTENYSSKESPQLTIADLLKK